MDVIVNGESNNEKWVSLCIGIEIGAIVKHLFHCSISVLLLIQLPSDSHILPLLYICVDINAIVEWPFHHSIFASTSMQLPNDLYLLPSLCICIDIDTKQRHSICASTIFFPLSNYINIDADVDRSLSTIIICSSQWYYHP